MIDEVAETIRKMDLPLNCRSMLAAMAPFSLGTLSEERQSLQKMAVEMIGSALSTHRASLQEAIGAEEKRLSEIEAASGAAEAKVLELEATAAEKHQSVEATKKMLADASQRVLQAKQSLSDVQNVVEKEAKLLTEAKGDQEAVVTALKENFEPLKSGDWETGQSKYHIDILVPLVNKIKLDESLATALPSSLTKKPAERGPFDRTVIEQLELALQSKIAEFTKFVHEADSRSTAQTAAVDAAQRAHEAAKEHQQQTAAELATSTSCQRELSANLAAAKTEVQSFGPEREKTTQTRSDKESALEVFDSGAMVCFRALQSKTALDTASGEASSKTDETLAEIPVPLPLGGQ
jgi:chromosome segregation ATPase